MAVTVQYSDPRDAARTVDALLVACDVERRRNPMRARKYMELANELADAVENSDCPVIGPDHWIGEQKAVV